MGGPLFVLVFRSSSNDVRQLARKVAVIAALIGLAVLALRFGIRAARISGMGLSGAVDPMMLGFVWDSPLGAAAIWRGAGELLVVALLIRGIVGLSAGLIGALLIAVSYTFVGHSLGDPRWLLASLLTLHLLAAAFWIGALLPLRHAVGQPEGARLLHRFGNVASLTVALLVVVGLIFAWLMTGSFSNLLSTAYGKTLLAKLGVVVGADGVGCAQQMAVRSGTCLWHTRSRASSAPLYSDRGYSCSAHLDGNGNAHFNHHAAGQPLKRNIS